MRSLPAKIKNTPERHKKPLRQVHRVAIRGAYISIYRTDTSVWWLASQSVSQSFRLTAAAGGHFKISLSTELKVSGRSKIALN